ncbi:LytTR family transcriptional regulator [Pedobacter frigiditerrae]|uniref:LytTR family transcriptional regulator n=1 Tax=Pedobacter frigiditerrae TaxID=2530452 RepID=A0A4R0MQU2_9SPHI|nr:LytTR family DNA-binding domain-containing protein [Pedobacter frigiditerrae]TCC88642.1 LytTR family transcriptional regulator [Pedobacter frigiditerrae]
MVEGYNDDDNVLIEAPIKYLHWRYRLLLSVVVSHLIITEGQPKSVWQILQQLNYWVAFVFSVSVAVLVMWLVHFVTRRLDRWLPWMTRLPHRIAMQFVLGICLILFLIYISVRCYFWGFGKDFYASGYMEVEFPIAKWMVLCMNILYIAWFYAESFIRSSIQNRRLSSELSGFYQMMERKEGYLRDLDAKLGNKLITISPSEVICFEREENVGYVWMMDGRKFIIDYKMQELAGILDPGMFYQISRSVMLSIAAVKGYEKVRNGQGLLILREGLAIEVSLLVSRDRFHGFKKVFDKYRLG